MIFHLAAQGEVRRSIEQPAFDATVNVVGTVNLVEAARASGVGRFMLASTGGAIYGEGSGRDLPVAESSSLEPLCPYGLSKLAGEEYLLLYRRMYGLSSVALRFANVYGPRQRPKGEAGAVAIFGELLLEGKRPVVFGDGTQTRDFVYIDDVIKAVLAATDSEMEGPVNIGSGIETSLLELLEGLSGPGRRATASTRSSTRRSAARSSGSRSTRVGPGASSTGSRRSASGTASAGPSRRCRRRAGLRGHSHRSRPSTLSPCPPRPTPERNASASTASRSATRPACATCWKPRSTSPV